MIGLWHLKLASVVAILFAVVWCSYDAGRTSVQTRWDRATAQAAENAKRLAGEYRLKERGWAGELQQAQDTLFAAQQATTSEVDRALTDVRADNLRLRERFRACERRVSTDTAASGSDDAAGEGGLSEQDQEFLVRIAGEADHLAHQLTACQAYVRSVAQ